MGRQSSIMSCNSIENLIKPNFGLMGINLVQANWDLLDLPEISISYYIYNLSQGYFSH